MFETSLIDELSSAVARDMWLIRPLSYRSLYDRVSDELGLLKTNHLQTLQHLGSIAELFSNPFELYNQLENLYSLYSVQNRTKGIAEALDLLTASWLKLNFQQLPLIRSSQELREKLPLLGQALAREIGDITLYTDPVTFSGPALGYKNFSITVRQVIHLRRLWSEFFQSLLGVNAIGLFPSFSNVYDLVPFSFALNWFTNLKRRMQLGETNLLAPLCFSFKHRVVSYTVRWSPTVEELASRHLYSNGPVSIKVYVREVSRFWPSPSPRALYDYAGVYPRPDVLTAGSLVWSLL